MTFPNVRAFARHMLRDGRLSIRFEPAALHFDGHAFQLVLWREDCWQLELVTLMPNLVVPQHRHDNCSTYDVYLGGNAKLESTEAVERQVARLADRLARGAPLFGVSVPAGTPHGGTVGPQGDCFLSFQRWSGPARFIHEDWQPCQ